MRSSPSGACHLGRGRTPSGYPWRRFDRPSRRWTPRGEVARPGMPLRRRTSRRPPGPGLAPQQVGHLLVLVVSDSAVEEGQQDRAVGHGFDVLDLGVHRHRPEDDVEVGVDVQIFSPMFRTAISHPPQPAPSTWRTRACQPSRSSSHLLHELELGIGHRREVNVAVRPGLLPGQPAGRAPGSPQPAW